MGKIHRNSLKPGHQLHWYEIKEILGQGGFGITYLAHDTNLDEDVAIKEYLPIELAVREGDFSVHPVSDAHDENYHWGLERFITEARTLTKFKHPNIVRVRNVFEDNNTAYMVMEYEKGKSLQEKLTGKKTLEEPELLKILIPILGGLEIVHQAGFIHRDIKPDNIFVRHDSSPVLLDFGSARQALGEQTKTLTSLVTPGYAPFEQYFSKSDEQGQWTDIYGMGATLYRAVTGIAPINAVDRSKAIHMTSKDTLVSAMEIGKGKYSDNFLKAIDHAIQFNQKDRPQSISEWRDEFAVEKEMAEIKHLREQEQTPTQPGTKVIRKSIARRLKPTTVLLFIALIGCVIAFYYRHSIGALISPYLPEPKEIVMSEEEIKQTQQRSALIMKRAENRKAQLKKEQAITQLLQEAEAYFNAKRLIEPTGENALETYLKVLELAPDNTNALSGKDRIFQHYVITADILIAEQKFSDAESALQRADVIKPNSTGVALARINLDKARQEAERLSNEQERQRQEKARQAQAALEKSRLEKRQKQLEEENRRLIEEARKKEEARHVELERKRQAEEERKRLAAQRRFVGLIKDGKEALSRKDYARAADKYKEALALYPNDVTAATELAAIEKIIAVCHGVSGSWAWFNGGSIEMRVDGKIYDRNGSAVGTWECSNLEKRQFILRWNAGWVDTLILSIKGDRLKGRNRFGVPVSGKKIN